MLLETNRDTIARLAKEKESENDAFREYLKQQNTQLVDVTVHRINEQVTPQIDCTQCGACCRQLMINVTEPDAGRMAQHLQLTPEQFKSEYVECGSQMMIMNTIPCHFLNGNKCSAYESRFSECREFPHLHKNNFVSRLFGTLVHYAMCPIIFNVLEQLKKATYFEYPADAEKRSRIIFDLF